MGASAVGTRTMCPPMGKLSAGKSTPPTRCMLLTSRANRCTTHSPCLQRVFVIIALTLQSDILFSPPRQSIFHSVQKLKNSLFRQMSNQRRSPTPSPPPQSSRRPLPRRNQTSPSSPPGKLLNRQRNQEARHKSRKSQLQ